MDETPRSNRLVAVTLDDDSIGRGRPDIEHERAVAIFDLLEGNSFTPKNHEKHGPYQLILKRADNRLVFDIRGQDDSLLVVHILSLTPLRRIVKDYFDVCESYYEAIKIAAPSRIEAIDMGRRGLHNEGSRVLQERLAGKIDTDFDTSRRLFTLICALHRRK